MLIDGYERRQMNTRFRVLFLSVGAFVVVGLPAVFLAYLAHYYTFSAANTSVTYLDVRRFEDVLGNLPPDDNSWPEALDADYLSRASRGLRSFMAAYNLEGNELAQMVSQDRDRWFDCQLSDRLKTVEPQIRRGLERFGILYPRALFPRIYFVVGSGQVKAIDSWVGVMVAAETYRPEVGDCNGQLEGARVFMEIPCAVIHELVHFNQAFLSPWSYSRERNNLARAVKEGSADFLAELAVDCHANPEAHRWGRTREAELWQEFQQVLDSEEPEDWFDVMTTGERPPSLGAFIGYNIVRAYYLQAPDKERAVRTIMNISDYPDFLEDSGYGRDL